MVVERRKVPDGGGAAGALDYSLNRWQALGRFLVSGQSSHLEH
jgi:transposase